MKKIILLALILLGVFIYFTAEKKNDDGPTAGAIVDRSSEVIAESAKYIKQTWTTVSDTFSTEQHEGTLTLPGTKNELWDLYYKKELPELCEMLYLITPDNAAEKQQELQMRYIRLQAFKKAYKASTNSDLQYNENRKADRYRATDQLGAAITYLYTKHPNCIHTEMSKILEEIASKPDIY